jgi:hypothetical protein
MIAIGINNLPRISASATIEMEPNEGWLEYYAMFADPRQDVYNPDRHFVETAVSTLQPIYDTIVKWTLQRQDEYAAGVPLKYFECELYDIGKTLKLDMFNESDIKLSTLDSLLYLLKQALIEGNVLFYYYSPMLVYNAFREDAIKINKGEVVTTDAIDAELIEKLLASNLILINGNRILLSDKMLRLSDWYK